MKSVRVEPAKEYDICYLGAEDNRVFRLQTMPGELTLHYQARVSLNPAVDSPPQIPEIDHPELPEEALPYLNPSRYCESDRLANFAMAEFGGLDRGYSRVAAICRMDVRPSEIPVRQYRPLRPVPVTCSSYAPVCAAITPIWRSPCAGRSASRRATFQVTPSPSIRLTFMAFSKPIWEITGICSMPRDWPRWTDSYASAWAATLPMCHSRLSSERRL